MTRPPVAVRDAATVMLLRDGDAGLEVFMLRRNPHSAFVADAYLFPGGAVDEDDRSTSAAAVCPGRSDDACSLALSMDRGALAFWIAAIRECFEEAGILLAERRDGELLRFDDEAVAVRYAHHRDAVERGERPFVEVCAAEDIVLAVDRLHYFSHWITPEGGVRRYDTRFFVAAMPPAQVPAHDAREAVAQLWIRPEDALARQRDGDFVLIEPTVRNLAALARFEGADDVLAAAAAAGPDVVRDEGGTRIRLPGDDARLAAEAHS
jgi:8-oxo-dGTP pyrophosphatase MutT (NUDIX family)